MNTYDNHPYELSDNELDAVSGCGDDKVTPEDVKAATSKGAGLAPLDLAAWVAAVRAMKH